MGESTGSIMGSSAALGGPFMPDLLLKLRLEPIVRCFDSLETWLGYPEFRHTSSGVKWTDKMIVRARFTIDDALYNYIYIYSV